MGRGNMKKSEKIIAACLMVAVGILLVVLKDDMISILMTILGVGLIALGIMDLVSRKIPLAAVKLVCGVFIIVCGWVIVNAVLYVLAAALLIVGILLVYYKIKKRVRGCTPFHTVCEYAIPGFYIAIGLLLLFHKSAAMEIILIICGVLTVIEGGVCLFNALSEK